MQEAAPRGKGGFRDAGPAGRAGVRALLGRMSGPGGGKAPRRRRARTYVRLGSPIKLGWVPSAGTASIGTRTR
jgi:hypothetical protein